MAANDVIVRLRMQGAQVFAAQAEVAAKGVADIGDQADKSSRKTSRFQSVMGKLAGPLKAGALALGAVGTAAAVMGVKYDMGMEQSRVAFRQFLGSTKAADSMITRLQKLNRATPFEFPELAGVTKRLLAMGFNAKDAVKQTSILSDAVAGIGGSGPELDRASLAIGQIATKGRLQAEDLMQLTELGIVGQQSLAKALGMTGEQFQKAMSKGQISSEEALGAINKVTKAQFGGAAAKQSKTFAGQLSNLKDSAQMLLGEAMIPLFTFLRDEGLPALNNAMPTLKAIAMGFGVGLVAAINGVITAVKFLSDNWKTITTVLVIASPLIAGITTYLVVMKTVTTAVAVATRLWAIAQAALNLAMSLNPIVLVIAGIVALGVAIVIAYKKFDWFRNAVNNVWAALKTAWSWIKSNWPLLLSILGGPFTAMAYLAIKNIDKIKAAFRGVVGWFKNLGGDIVHAVAEGVSSAPDAIIDALMSLLPGGAVGKKLAGLVIPGHAFGGIQAHTGLALVGERGPELVSLPGGTRVSPLPAGGVPTPALGGAVGGLLPPIVTQVFLDRRQIATAVAEDTADRKARR